MTPEAMDELHTAFNEAWEAEEFEKLLLIPAYILDFLCIHPFRAHHPSVFLYARLTAGVRV